MSVADRNSESYCVIGAGASGLTVLKNFREAAIPVQVLEREDDVGGNWYYGRPSSSVYRSAHLISSKQLTQYPDFPMPEDWPEYPSQKQVLEYFRAYTTQFGLRQAIQFGITVTRIEPANDLATSWIVTLSTGERRQYCGVIIANGHHWDPNCPSYPGQFNGDVLHSSEYKTPEVLAGKRVLVIGAGNSGCDIAVESANHAAATFHSLRRGYHFIPKFIRGKPADRCNEFFLRWRFPLWLRRRLAARAIRIALGPPEEFGLPTPDHKLFETHPIINSQMTYFVGHGRIKPKPDVAEFCGDRVRFTDGSIEPIDLIIYATGFKLSFPFIDQKYLNWHDGKPQLFLNVFHPQYDNLFIAGMIQPDSGIWGLAHYQSQLIAQFIKLQTSNPPLAEKFRRLKSQTQDNLAGGIHYVRSPRHAIEVEHFSYRRQLRRLLRKFSTI
jgi:cation diffusion facilitator CzcD-associated flavoprotein CzcO